MGNSWIELIDFLSINEKNSTTGQPFILKDGTILIPVWDYRYYEFGRSGLSIYRSEDNGSSWIRVYENPYATYGNHFFEGKSKNEIYLCAGIGGGGFEGRISYVPDQGLLLKSQDSGVSWDPCLKVETPTAIYDGIFTNDSLIVSARDRASIFKSDNFGKTWKEIHFGRPTRSLTNSEIGILMSSDSAIFVSQDNGTNWVRMILPIKKLVLRYPIQFQDKFLMAGAGWRSLILGINPKKNEWCISFDATKVVKSRFMTRLCIAKNCLFIGDEIEAGVLLRIPTSSLENKHTFPYSILSLRGPLQILKGFEKVTKTYD